MTHMQQLVIILFLGNVFFCLAEGKLRTMTEVLILLALNVFQAFSDYALSYTKSFFKLYISFQPEHLIRLFLKYSTGFEL